MFGFPWMSASRHNAADDNFSTYLLNRAPTWSTSCRLRHSSDVEAIVKKYVDNAVRTYAQASHNSWVSLELNGTAKIEKSLRIGRISIKPSNFDLVKTGQSAVIAAMACYEYASGELKRCLDKAVDRIRLALFDWRTRFWSFSRRLYRARSSAPAVCTENVSLSQIPSAWREGPNRVMNARCGTCST